MTATGDHAHRIEPRSDARASLETVLGTTVALLFGWGALDVSQAGYRPLPAVVIGIADAALGLLVILANVLLK